MSGRSGARRDDDDEIRIGWQMAGLGFQSTSEVLAGAALGWLWDQWRGTAPTGLTVGAIVGLAVGLFTLVRRSLALNRRLDTIARRRQSNPKAATDRGRETGPADHEDADDWDKRWNEKWADDDGRVDEP